VNDKTSETERFFSKCRENNLKITPQRRVLFEALLSADDHPTAEVMYRRVREKLPNISYDTVNRTLLTFVEVGIIRQAESRESAKRFDPNVERHHHFHCIKCGRIIDFVDPNYDNFDSPRNLPEGLLVLGGRVVLEGICDRCRE